MPNIPPQGIFSAKRSEDEIPVTGKTPVTDAKATLPGETTPRQVTEIWASNAAGQPRLVWVAKPDGPASATAAWIAASGVMRISWVPLNPVRHDRYAIVRPDGTLAGTALQGATSFDDPSPRAVNGAYKVVAQLEAMSDVTPTVTNTVNLTTGPVSCNASLIGGDHVRVTWAHPAYGQPQKYRIYRYIGVTGTFMVELPGSTLAWDEAHGVMATGDSPSYRVVPTFAAGESSGVCQSQAVPIPPLDPIIVGLTDRGVPNQLMITFAYPGGAITRYEIQHYDGNAPGWVNHDLNNTSGSSVWTTTTNIGYMRVRSIGVNGLPSNYVQVGPLAAIVPDPIVALGGGLTIQPSGLAQMTQVTETFDTFCCEYYWSGFPEFGWRNVGFSNGSSDNTCQPGDPVNNGLVWWGFQRLQNTPTYARVKRVRNGISSGWVQYGPV